MIAIWHRFTYNTAYRDLGGDYLLERTGRTRVTRRRISQLDQLGFQVTPATREGTTWADREEGLRRSHAELLRTRRPRRPVRHRLGRPAHHRAGAQH